MRLISVLVILGILAQEIESSGRISIKLNAYINTYNFLFNGNCCNGLEQIVNKEILCVEGCDTVLKLCLDRYKSIEDFNICPYGEKILSPIYRKNFTLFSSPISGNIENPVVFPFERNYQTVGYRLKISTYNRFVDRLEPIDFIRIDFTIPTPNSFSNQTSRFIEINDKIGNRTLVTPTSISLDVSSYCDKNWYGKSCETYCLEQDACDGHYTCDLNTGAKVCRTGYSGIDCDIPDLAIIGCSPSENEFCNYVNGSFCYKYSSSRPVCCCPRGFGVPPCNQIKKCFSDTCYNDGVCSENSDGSNECQCPPSTFGIRCEITCNGNGCECPQGYKGDKCSIKQSLCDSNPCGTHGVCQELSELSYECLCFAGYTGALCNRETDYCSSEPCSNNATCVNNLNGFICKCQQGYTGIQCQSKAVKLSICDTNPCLNGGECLSSSSLSLLATSYECKCLAGFRGVNCEVSNNPCESPTVCSNNGICKPLNETTHFCECAPGYAGNSCEVDVQECNSHPCQHGGTCIELTPPNIKCTCLRGFTGEFCQSTVSVCQLLRPCQNNGFCTEVAASVSVLGFVCNCNLGFSGTYCEKFENPCSSFPCANGGFCTSLSSIPSKYTCICQKNWTGPHCTEQIIPNCVNNMCRSGSTCVSGTSLNSYICKCPFGHTGKYCENRMADVDECTSKPCLNGGLCLLKSVGYLCMCKLEYTGSNCQYLMNYCTSKPCQNGGTCVHSSLGYTCSCPPNFTAKNCEVNILH